MTKADTTPPALVANVRNLSVSLGDTALVHDISFTIAQGECLGIVGESGSGKSLTSRSLIGLNDAELTVTAERLDLFGEDYRQAGERQWRAVRGRRVGYVLQDALGSLDPLKDIYHEVSEALAAHRIGNRAERRELVMDALTRTGFPDPELRSRHRSYELSGGLRQRALIATAIVASPQLLIADEPTTALDVNVQAMVVRLLEQLKDLGMGLLFVSHDLAVVSSIADKIIVMNKGRVEEAGRAVDVLTNPTSDYTRMLLAAMPSQAAKGTRLSPGDARPIVRPSGVSRGGLPQDKDQPVLAAEGLTKSFIFPDGRRVEVVSDVSFALHKGKILGLVGGSGSGKSTAVKLCMGMLTPDRGEVRLYGQPWSAMSEAQRNPLRPRIQLISQDPLGSFDPRFTVRRLLNEALAIGGVHDAAQLRVDAARLLEAVGLNETHLDKLPRKLSGGQRQRVAIARALATGPDVLVCDEPVSALDVSVQAQVLDLLSDLQREFELSILFISHDLGVIRYFCDDVLVMHQGRIVERGEVAATFAAARHSYTRELLASIPVLRTAATP